MQARETKTMHVCSWCKRGIDAEDGMLSGERVTNWGMCSHCLDERLSQLDVATPAAPRRRRAASRSGNPVDVESASLL